MSVTIAPCSADHIDAWIALRSALWPDASLAEHRREVAALLDGTDGAIAFIAQDPEGQVLGFAEASLRHDYVNGCDTSPVGFLEGLFVETHARRRGVARGLVAAVEHWARSLGCSELASDALLANAASHAMHGALDFEETERVVYFRKELAESKSH